MQPVELMRSAPCSGCTKKGKVGRWGRKMVQMNHTYAYFYQQANFSHRRNPLAARHSQSWLLFTRVLVNATLTRLHEHNLSAAAQLAFNLLLVYNQSIRNIFCIFYSDRLSAAVTFYCSLVGDEC
jgi:hypothetical protein